MSYDTFVHWGAKIPIRKVPWRLLLGDRSPWLAEAAPVRVSVTADALCLWSQTVFTFGRPPPAGQQDVGGIYSCGSRPSVEDVFPWDRCSTVYRLPVDGGWGRF